MTLPLSALWLDADAVGRMLSLSGRVVRVAFERTAGAAEADLRQTANSYFGLLRQASASHADRARLANVVRDRGRSVDRTFTKMFGAPCS